MRTFRRPALAVFVLVHLFPTFAWSQGERVGVVTTLEGNVTARRAVLPQPVPLKFKDDVFFRDTITTGDQSLARVLLGGKSIVTVRERSVVTITESPGRSYISLESGKIGLAVAREKLAPGESVDVRTPNAVVGVRGTVIVAEVVSAATATSHIYFLRGSGECFAVDQRTGRPIGSPVTLKPLESFKVVGSAARVEPIPASQIGQCPVFDDGATMEDPHRVLQSGYLKVTRSPFVRVTAFSVNGLLSVLVNPGWFRSCHWVRPFSKSIAPEIPSTATATV